MGNTRRKYTSKFKSKVAIEAIKEEKTTKEIASKYNLHPNQISTWKSEFLKNAEVVFDKKTKTKEEKIESEKLYKTIGELKVENDFLKQVLGK